MLMSFSDLEIILERGAEYEFRLAAKNDVDYGEVAVETITTPDGSEFLYKMRTLFLLAKAAA